MIKLSIRVMAMFSIAILISFIPEYFRDFFGDWKCAGSGNYILGTYRYEGCNSGLKGIHEATWHWGYRHFLFFVMGVVLFIIQMIDALNKEIK
jgi:hypothetical protein